MRVVLLFFQAEDGIRDYKVTGVQTCALPISVDCTPPLTAARASPLVTLPSCRPTGCSRPAAWQRRAWRHRPCCRQWQQQRRGEQQGARGRGGGAGGGGGRGPPPPPPGGAFGGGGRAHACSHAPL